MPLTINVGLSRKASENYQSTGVSINVSAELDQSLLARPAELQNTIEHLYQQAETALDRQAGAPQQATPLATAARGNGQGSTTVGGNGNNGKGNGQAPAPMTASQSRAITAIAKRLDIDPAAECQEILGLDRAKLNIRQASEFIDHLKALSQPQGQPAGNGGHWPCYEGVERLEGGNIGAPKSASSECPPHIRRCTPPFVPPSGQHGQPEPGWWPSLSPRAYNQKKRPLVDVCILRITDSGHGRRQSGGQ